MQNPLSGKREEFLHFAKPCLDDGEIEAVQKALQSGWLTTGPLTSEFQTCFAEYVGHSHALGLSSCTAGLFLALKLYEIGPGDEVIVPTITFAATANVVEHLGAKPVFVDVDPETGLISPEKVEEAITPATKAVLVVHLYGQSADNEALRDIATRHSLKIIADCAHATETRVGDKHVSDWADAAAFSFYATKNLAVGEGGMLVTNSEEFYERAQILALHGMSRGAYARYHTKGFQLYDIVTPGYKFNMTDISAALGIEQLKRLHNRLRRREEIWNRYNEAFADLQLLLPPETSSEVVNARHLYTLRTKEGISRDKILDGLIDENIGCAIHFIALHLTSFYSGKYGYRRGDLPNAERFSDSLFSIPLTPYLTDEEVNDVIRAVRTVVE